MSRLFLILTIVLCSSSLFAPLVRAQVPDSANSSVQWVSAPDAYDIMICPLGDATYLDVYVRDNLNNPIGGVLVDATFGHARVYLKSPVQGYTDAGGYVKLDIQGGIQTVPTDSLKTFVSTVTVSCPVYGVTLLFDAKWIISPDMDQSGSPLCVAGLDYSYFSATWLDWEKRSIGNFDRLCPGLMGECVEGLDYTIFTAHWLHQ